MISFHKTSSSFDHNRDKELPMKKEKRVSSSFLELLKEELEKDGDRENIKREQETFVRYQSKKGSILDRIAFATISKS